MKKIKKKTISRILAFILFFSGIFYASFYPETFLNTKSIKFVINLLPKNLEINYEEFSLDIKSKNFFNKDFNVYGKNFCFHGKDIPFSGCFNVSASGTFNLKKIKTYVKTIEVKKSNLTIPQGVKKKREKPLTLSRFYHFDFLKKINRWIEVEKGSIEYFKINNVEILNKKLSFLNSQLKIDDLIINIKQNNLLEINLKTALVSHKKSKILGYIKPSSYEKINISLDIENDRGFAKIQTKEQSNPAEVFLDLKQNSISGLFYGKLKSKFVFYNSKINNCAFKLNLQNNKIYIKNNCNITSSVKSSQIGLNLDNFNIEINTASEGFFSLTDNSFLIKNNVLTEEINANNLFINSRSDFEIDSKKLKEKILDINFNLEASSKNFKNIVDIFRKTEYSIPAPLNSLKGPSDVTLSGAFNPLNFIGEIPLALNTKLRSRNQFLDLTGTGTLYTKKDQQKIEASLFLNQSQVILPNIKIKDQEKSLNVPLVKDSRFLTKKTKFSKNKLDYNLKVKTLNPLFLISNLANSKIPIQLDLSLSPKNPKGLVGIDQFSLELFKRKAKIKKLNFNVKNSKEIEVDGLIEVEYSDYKIFITVYGDSKSPQFVFESEPSLPEKSVISVLLFGTPIEDAESDQSEASSEFQTAAAQGALGLTSLILFASTPIESFNYNPQSEKITARLRVSKQTSLIYGQDSNESQYGIRQKIGPNLFLETFYNNSDEGESSTSGFINWSKRY